MLTAVLAVVSRGAAVPSYLTARAAIGDFGCFFCFALLDVAICAVCACRFGIGLIYLIFGAESRADARACAVAAAFCCSNFSL